MTSLRANQALVADNVVLDGRLALFHETERWLAVADLHFGYELSQRAAGWLVPMWGMASIAQRLLELVGDYNPARLIVLGDLVHDKTAAAEAAGLLGDLGARCETVVVAGNHDRRVRAKIEMVDSWQTDRFYFHHGHCAAEAGERIQIVGHHHPAGVLADGAGLRLKCPAFVQQSNCWIMPAFSPWAAGTRWVPDESSRIWLCTPERVLPLPTKEAA
ncbi:MAG TPA: metallophosphoesterase [Chthoniobacterales bacterium]|jgi:DNA ligase-associated metallophosphoesterase|nr:metallophosphoesterase [Chthoniobacterales bacterium]